MASVLTLGVWLRYKIESELENWLQKYDSEMTEKLDILETMTAEFEAETAEREEYEVRDLTRQSAFNRGRGWLGMPFLLGTTLYTQCESRVLPTLVAIVMLLLQMSSCTSVPNRFCFSHYS